MGSTDSTCALYLLFVIDTTQYHIEKKHKQGETGSNSVWCDKAVVRCRLVSDTVYNKVKNWGRGGALYK